MKRFSYYVGILSVFVAISFLCSCLSAKTKEICETAVDKFHAQLNEGNFHEIYANSGQELKDSITENEFNQFLDAVHRKLGNANQKQMTSWNTNFNTKGNFVALGYETQFAEDKAVENFSFKINGDDAILVGYYINSKALIIK